MEKQVDRKDKLLALIEMCLGLNKLEGMGLIKTEPDGEGVSSTPKSNMLYLNLRKHTNGDYPKC